MREIFAVYQDGKLSKKVEVPYGSTPSYVRRAAKVNKLAGVCSDSATVYEKRQVREASRPNQ